MDKDYFQQMNYELKDIRNRREILYDRKKNLKKKYFVSNLAKRVIGKGSNEKYFNLIEKIDKYDLLLEGKYIPIRERYKERFANFTYWELFEENQKIVDRIDDLEKRLHEAKTSKEKISRIFSGEKRKAVRELVYEIEEEYKRRGRAFEDLVTEQRKRGIDVEAMVMGSLYKENPMDERHLQKFSEN